MLSGVHDLPIFLAAGLALNLTPGPDMLYVAGTAASRGTRAGLAAALGVGVGCLLHVALAALGVAALLASSPLAFAALKWAGAGYLVYIGARGLWQSRRKSAVTEAAVAPTAAAGAGNDATGLWPTFWQGAFINALNPKVALFFLAFLPQFIDAGGAAQGLAMFWLGLMFDTSGTAVNLAVAWLAGAAGARWAQASATGALRGLLERAAGVLFIALGLRIALSAR
jgi:threonine/homoserine/homoserine lactone efflux protein